MTGSNTRRNLGFGALAVGMALTLAVALGFGTTLLRGQSRSALVAVFVTSAAGDHLGASTIEVHDLSGWQRIGSGTALDVPAAPATGTLLRAKAVVGVYDSLRVGGRVLTAGLAVSENHVLPVLVVVAGGQAVDLYAGNDEFNVGLGELSGKLRPLAPFHLLDQGGRPLDLSRLAGRETVLAAFHTNCRETCPIYTGLFLQLSRQAPAGVQLLEVTTDPVTDTPAVLNDYAGRVGAKWIFGSGSAEALAAFWAPFGVQLSTADQHSSVLVVIDRHGFVRLARSGVPDVATLPPVLSGQLSAAGRAELGHGEGWGAPAILDVLRSLGSLAARSLPGGSPAPAFTARDLAGRPVSLADFAGRPVVINFWASYCVPCRAELPLLERTAAARPEVGLLLVDERDSGPAARSFLEGAGVRSRSAGDPDGTVGNLYGVEVLPTTVFVRADGTIESRQLGQLDATTLAGHLAAIGG